MKNLLLFALVSIQVLFVIAWICSKIFQRRNVVAENVILRSILLVVMIAPVLGLCTSVLNDLKKPLHLPNFQPIWSDPVSKNEDLSSTSNARASQPADRSVVDNFMVREFILSPAFWGSLWVLISGVFIVRLLIAHFRLSRLCRESVFAEESLQSELDQIARRLGVRAPQLLRSHQIPGPALVGLVRPKLLIPEKMKRVAAQVFLHELAHLQRKDTWWLLLGRVAIALHFYNPLVWYLIRRQEASSEEICDEFVLLQSTRPSDYASELIQQAHHHDTELEFNATCIFMASAQSALGRRVEKILDWNGCRTRLHPALRHATSVGAVAMIALFCSLRLESSTPVVELRSISPNKTAEISQIVKSIKIDYVGPKYPKENEILDLINLEVGEFCTTESIEGAIRLLYASGKIRNCRIVPQTESGGVHLQVVIQPQPWIRAFQFDGFSQMAEPDLQKIILSKANQPMSDLQLWKDCRNLEKDLQSRGFTAVRVSYQSEIDEAHGKVDIQFKAE